MNDVDVSPNDGSMKGCETSAVGGVDGDARRTDKINELLETAKL